MVKEDIMCVPKMMKGGKAAGMDGTVVMLLRIFNRCIETDIYVYIYTWGLVANWVELALAVQEVSGFYSY